MAPKTDLYQTITDRIISELEAGRIPWDQHGPRNYLGKERGKQIDPQKAKEGCNL